MSAAKAVRWWWVRHAPIVGLHGVIHGNLDAACDLSSVSSFKALAKVLPAKALWLASNLSRAKETAAAIARHGIDIPCPVIEKNLAEQDFGVWQGKTWDDLLDGPGAKENKDYQAFWQNPAQNAPPGGESFRSVFHRVSNLVERFNAQLQNAKPPGGDIVAIAHAGPIRAAIALALGLDLQKALAIRIDPLTLTRLDFAAAGDTPSFVNQGGWMVGGVNLPPLAP